jgi:hypothetical protein
MRESDAETSLPIQGRSEAALVPFATRREMLETMLRLTRGGHPREFAERYETGPRAQSEPVRRQARAIVSDILEKLRRPRRAPDFTSGFFPANETLEEELVVLLRDRRGTAQLEDVTVERIARHAEVPIPEGRRRGNQRYELNLRAFLNQLEAHLYSRTGIRLTFTPHLTNENQIARVRLRYVHLGAIPANSGPYNTIRDAHAGRLPSGLSFTTLRAYLRARFPLPHPWERRGSAPVLPESELRRIAVASAPPAALDPEDVPPWNRYKQTSPAEQVIGLRVGTHGDFTARSGVLSRIDRRSHHLPQYLLVQYYRGENPTKVFGRDNHYWMPGFRRGSREVGHRDRLRSPMDSHVSSRGTLAMSELDPTRSNRGAGMAAVLLAKETHETGGLHLNLESSWDSASEIAGRPSQSLTMDNRHHEYLVNGVQTSGALSARRSGVNLDNGAEFSAMVQATVSDGVSAEVEALKDIQNEAMREAYGMFVGRMAPALSDALQGIEGPYYERIASQSSRYDADLVSPSYSMLKDSTDWIGAVMNALAQKNRDLMGSSGTAGNWGANDVWASP